MTTINEIVRLCIWNTRVLTMSFPYQSDLPEHPDIAEIGPPKYETIKVINPYFDSINTEGMLREQLIVMATSVLDAGKLERLEKIVSELKRVLNADKC